MAPRLHLALVEPAIPQNTGNVGRLALAFGFRLHLVGKLGFSIDEKACRRAGLDYWKHVDVARWDDLDALARALPKSRLWLFSAHGRTSLADVEFREGDVLVFGNEARGLPPGLVAAAGERSVVIPLASPLVRSLNLANAVSIGVYEASRRLGFPKVEAQVDPELVKLVATESEEEREPGRPVRGARAAVKALAPEARRPRKRP
jgi:tRNA (cytidine/uridine-2'-O-)-methyltransferase